MKSIRIENLAVAVILVFCSLLFSFKFSYAQTGASLMDLVDPYLQNDAEATQESLKELMHDETFRRRYTQAALDFQTALSTETLLNYAFHSRSNRDLPGYVGRIIVEDFGVVEYGYRDKNTGRLLDIDPFRPIFSSLHLMSEEEFRYFTNMFSKKIIEIRKVFVSLNALKWRLVERQMHQQNSTKRRRYDHRVIDVIWPRNEVNLSLMQVSLIEAIFQDSTLYRQSSGALSLERKFKLLHALAEQGSFPYSLQRWFANQWQLYYFHLLQDPIARENLLRPNVSNQIDGIINLIRKSNAPRPFGDSSNVIMCASLF